MLSVAVNLALNLWLVRVRGYSGLALGTALAAIFNATILLWLLRRRLGGLDGRPLAVAALKITVASMLMAVVARMVWDWLMEALPGGGELLRILRVCLSIGAGIVVLAVAAKLLRVEEFDEASRRLLRRGLRRNTDAP